MQDGVKRLLEVLTGLDFACTNMNTPNANAQRKLSKQVNKWFTIIIWTTITADGVLPKGRRAVKVVLVGNGQRLVWELKKTLRYKNRKTFAQRLRRRAELLAALAQSRQQCPQHKHSFMSLGVTRDEQLCWVCQDVGCVTALPVDAALARQIKAETPARFWDEQRQR